MKRKPTLGAHIEKKANLMCTKREACFTGVISTLGEHGSQPYVNEEANLGCAFCRALISIRSPSTKDYIHIKSIKGQLTILT